MSVVQEATPHGKARRASKTSTKSTPNQLSVQSQPPRFVLPRQNSVHSQTGSNHDLELGIAVKVCEPDVPERRVTVCEKCKRLTKLLYKKLGLRYLIPVLIIILYTIFGALLFMALERNNYLDSIAKARAKIEIGRTAIIQDMLNRIRQVVGTINVGTINRTVTEVEPFFDQFEKDVIRCWRQPEWDFWSAMYYSGTIYTTIGYGNMSCATVWGRLATIFYALFGIPLLLICLNDLGIWLLSTITRSIGVLHRLKDSIRLKLAHRRQQKKRTISARSEDEGDDTDRSLDMPKIDASESNDRNYKIPISAALFITIGWIFLCSGIFMIWEGEEWNYNYFTAVYFFFITLSTIGLGDEVPKRLDLMILVFPVVIIGLSLVSMCISVIQARLEELLLGFLMKMVNEYQKNLSGGQDQVSACMGMMSSWNKNKQAKYVTQLLSKERKLTVLQQLNDEAKANGLVLPPVLQHVNLATGLPKVFDKVDTSQMQPPLPKEAALLKHIQESIQQADEAVLQRSSPSPLPTRREIPSAPSVSSSERHPAFEKDLNTASVYCYEADTQTELIAHDEKQNQTAIVEFLNIALQTLHSAFDSNDSMTQTGQLDVFDSEVQTTTITLREETSQTAVEPLVESAVQTAAKSVKEQELQTHLVELAEIECQTGMDILDIAPINDKPQTTEQSVQTDEVTTSDESLSNRQRSPSAEQDWLEEESGEPKLSQFGLAARRIKRAFHRNKKEPKKKISKATKKHKATSSETTEHTKGSKEKIHRKREKKHQPAETAENIASSEEEISETEKSSGSQESLVWDPIDGMHAEKQKRVSDLKKMFEQSRAAAGERRRSTVGTLKKLPM